LKFVTWILPQLTARYIFSNQSKAGLAGFENLNTQPPESIDHSYLGSIKTSEVKYFWNILYFPRPVTSIADLNKVLEERQVRYLSKLGDYVRIIKHMPLLLKKAGKAKITIEQVIT